MHFLGKKQTDTSENERLAWLRLFRTKHVGVVTFQKLLSRYGTASDAIDALPDLAKRGGASKPLKPPPLVTIEKEIKALNKLGGRIIIANDPDYPEMLAACDDAPPVISIIGNTKLMHQSCIAMVGARNASLNGRKFATKIARELGERDHIVVSGLARGIDTAAHNGALETGTIAVVAGGIDVVYPEENQKLYEQIAEQGLIIAESPLGSKPFRESFPRRNRIVSGLSKGTIVVEATMRSGSLITARLAGEQGRDVFAVPGHPMDPRASGPNKLIRDGATLIRDTDDVLENLINTLPNPPQNTLFDNPQSPIEKSFANENEVPHNAHESVLSNLSFAPIGIDELIRSCQLDISVMHTILLELELAGRINRLHGNRVVLLETE
jgi:DNA processing protein